VHGFLKAGGRGNVKRWAQAAAMTAARAGLLLSGDLEVACRLLRAQRTMPGDLSAGACCTDLVRWFVSEHFFALRAELGIGIGEDE
jgi:hypothetical protein